jgi:hypothetical protein
VDNIFDTMRAAVAEARLTMVAANEMARKIAPLLRGRLRECSGDDLAALKRDLRDFNLTTHRWKD